MLPTKPQSIIDLLLYSLKAYKKMFVAILPISALLISMHLIGRSLGMTDQPWVVWSSLIFFFFSFFCFFWGICFVYDFIASKKVSYKESLMVVLEKSFQITALLFIGIIFIAGMASFAVAMQDFILPGKIIFRFIYASVVVVLFVPILCFMFISILETLIKEVGFFSAIQKGINVSFSLEAIWRFLGWILIMMLLALIVFAPSLLLTFLLSWLKFNLVVSVAVGMASIFLTMILLWIPLKISIFVYLYNDLILRFEKE